MRSRSLMAATLVAALALGVGGCATENRVTEQSRELNWQTYQAAAMVNAWVSGIAANWLPVPVAQQLPGIILASKDVKDNTALILKVQGEPKKKEGYSPEASAQKRKETEESYAESMWKMGLIGGLGVLLPVLVNKFAPGLGTLAGNVFGGLFKSKGTKMAEATMAGVEQYMEKNPDQAKALAGYLERAQHQVGAKTLAGQVLEHVKSNVVPTLPKRRVQEDPEPTAAAPAPAVPQTTEPAAAPTESPPATPSA